MKGRILLLLVLLLGLPPMLVLAQSTDKASATSIQESADQARKHLLLLIKVGESAKASSSASSSVSTVRINNESTPLYSDRFDTTTFIRNALINEEFVVLRDGMGQLQIELKDGTTAWVNKSNVNWINQGDELGGISKTMTNNRAELEQLARRTYSMITDLQVQMELDMKKAGPLTPAAAAYKKQFDQYVSNATIYFNRNFTAINTNTPSLKFSDKFSATATVSGGFSRFNDNLSDGTENLIKGGIGEVQVGLGYQLDATSRITTNFGVNSDLLGTAFRQGKFDVGYNKRTDRTTFNTGFGLDTYKDKNLPINSYNRVTLLGNVRHALSKKTTVDAQYNLLYNGYRRPTIPNYTQNNLALGIRSKVSSSKILGAAIRVKHSASKRNDFTFINLFPQLSLTSTKAKARTDYVLGAEYFAFKKLALNKTIRANLILPIPSEKAPSSLCGTMPSLHTHSTQIMRC